MGPGPSLGRSDESAADPPMPGFLRDDERGQPGNIVSRVYGRECVRRSHSHDAALQLCDEGDCAATRCEACEAARKVSSVGWIPKLP